MPKLGVPDVGVDFFAEIIECTIATLSEFDLLFFVGDELFFLECFEVFV